MREAEHRLRASSAVLVIVTGAVMVAAAGPHSLAQHVIAVLTSTLTVWALTGRRRRA
jgi:hypothetical protein